MYTTLQVCFQAAKKEHELEVKYFVLKLTTSRDGHYKKCRNKARMKTQEDYHATEKSW